MGEEGSGKTPVGDRVLYSTWNTALLLGLIPTLEVKGELIQVDHRDMYSVPVPAVLHPMSPNHTD